MSFACINQLEGRLGNQIYAISMLASYAKKHNLEWYIPSFAGSDAKTPYYFPGKFPILTPELRKEIKQIFYEPMGPDGNPYYFEIPRMENVAFSGFWQSFKFFDWNREGILDLFGFDWTINRGVVGIHRRLGDYLIYSSSFPPLSLEFYRKSIQYFYEQGYREFIVCSDGIPQCKKEFESLGLPVNFHYAEGNLPLRDFQLLSSTEHMIVANSTFSILAAWFNRNPAKAIICPPQSKMFKVCNRDILPEEWIKMEF